LVFGQGGGADCIWTFNEKAVGEQFLFYLHTPEKGDFRDNSSEDPILWSAITCGRSTSLEWATEDLLYLENMNKVRGKTRISGTIETWVDSDLEFEGRKIRLIGPKKSYEVKTGKHGVFEIYDLPPGKYSIDPDVPAGWTMERTWMRGSMSEVSEKDGNQGPTTSRQITVLLEQKKHARIDIIFEIDNAVRGVVYDPNSKPMKGVCVNLRPAKSDEEAGLNSDCTDPEGRFEITSVPSGSYVVVINADEQLSSTQPFKRIYYPGVSEREKALVITVGPGDQVNDLNIVVPVLEATITVEGVLHYSDGTPVSTAQVYFTGEETKTTYGNARDETDAVGRFSIKILKGLKGEIAAEKFVYAGKFENCPKVEELVRKSGNTFSVIKTNVIAIQAEENMYGLELVFPFPSCKEKK